MCGIKDFCVVGCFDAQDFSDAVAVDGIESVELGLGDGCRLQTICEHGNEGGFVDSKFEVLCDVGVPPKLLQLFEASSDFANPGVDVCEGAAVIPEDDSQVFGSVVVWDCGVVCEVDGVGGVHFHVDAFGCVEFEVVEFGYVLDMV